eukprot:CAMPEP_0177716752 /NCGR_PEP_ID=MMETSP0484_2-20121128/14671_1 /TAXON_ID=354590 /ORGANISM="Rhodomonas lens, Strain RHODO" /LENGTH=127 /DNA_ID=CAMNT_0019228791 /DNA_START=13 /DNA_END=396 /DNA_ORIENTATION=-
MSDDIIYHMCSKAKWEAAGDDYTPPTYEKDGFVHATKEASMLCGIANHFYKGEVGDWILLKISIAKLTHPVKWEAPMAVGDKETNLKDDGGVQMPHIYGPINKPAVVEISPISREADGTFLASSFEF